METGEPTKPTRGLTTTRFNVTLDLMKSPKCPHCGNDLQPQVTRFRYGVAFCGLCAQLDGAILIYIKLAITSGYLTYHWVNAHGLLFWCPQPHAGHTVTDALHSLDPAKEPYDLTSNANLYPTSTTDDHPDHLPNADGSMPQPPGIPARDVGPTPNREPRPATHGRTHSANMIPTG